jgi:hypothetical protein
MKIEFNQAEIEILLYWIEQSLSRSTRYGGPEILFPEDQIVIKKLRENTGTYEITKDELEYIVDAMSATINSKYGNKIYLFGLEKVLYEKILFLSTTYDNSE